MENQSEENLQALPEKKEWIKPAMHVIIDINSAGGGGLESATGGIAS
jgi:hypothetical protein